MLAAVQGAARKNDGGSAPELNGAARKKDVGNRKPGCKIS
jgi:hypothetical protein